MLFYNLIKSTLPPIHPAGHVFIAGAALTMFVLGWIWLPLGWIGLLVTLWMAYFFRDPERATPVRSGLVLSPADGRVTMVGEAMPPAELSLGSKPLTRISIFLDVFDVHVTRVPVDGTVVTQAYHKGQFINAALDKSSEVNERLSIRLAMADGRDIGVVLIAGLIARRIVCDLREGQGVKAGMRCGIIRFGSRADLYLPSGAAPLVGVGQRMIGGETVMADLHSGERARIVEVR